MSTMKSFSVGDRVRLTADFLRNTGQYTGPEPFARWMVLAVQTFSQGVVLVVTNELRDHPEEWFTPEELVADPWCKYRRVLACNLETCR